MTPDRSLVVKLPDDEHRALKAKAVELDATMSDIVRALVQGFLKGEIQVTLETLKG